MNVSLSLTVPEGWIEGFILTTDLFRYNAIGYWAHGFAWGKDRWIIVEHNDELPPPRRLDDAVCDAILNVRWGDALAVARILDATLPVWSDPTRDKAGPLLVSPSRVHFMARKDAARVYAQAVRLYGEREAASVDASQLDVAVQYALGVVNLDGSAKYG